MTVTTMHEARPSPVVLPLDLVRAGLAEYDGGGLKRGSFTGWKSLDELYTVAVSQWTVVTGIPGSGKSELVDALMVNLAESGEWHFGIYSPENYPTHVHLVKLVEKRIRKPFGLGVVPRMTRDEYMAGATWVCERFFWLEPELRTPDGLIAKCLAYRKPGKKFGIVLDPWNTLDHERAGLSETDYTAAMLTDVQRLARVGRCHVWLVVHPQKLYRSKKDGSFPLPTPYDLIGSSHWFNKADNIICIDRDKDEHAQDVDVYAQKIRFKAIGHSGLATLKYDKVTGRYFDLGHSAIAGELYVDPERGGTPPEIDPEAAAERAAIQAEGA